MVSRIRLSLHVGLLCDLQTASIQGQQRQETALQPITLFIWGETMSVRPAVEEQLQVLAILKRQYPIPKKTPKPYQSYHHWRIIDWYARPAVLYFHLEYGKHIGHSMIQADFFEWRWTPSRNVWLKVDRATREMTEITEEEFDER